MNREKWKKDLDSVQETVKETISELKNTENEGLGGAALFAERLERDAEALQKLKENTI